MATQACFECLLYWLVEPGELIGIAGVHNTMVAVPIMSLMSYWYWMALGTLADTTKVGDLGNQCIVERP